MRIDIEIYVNNRPLREKKLKGGSIEEIMEKIVLLKLQRKNKVPRWKGFLEW